MQLGIFARRVDCDAKAFGVRAMNVAEMHQEYDDSILSGDRADCEEVVVANPLVRGFLQEGAGRIARETQIRQLPEEAKRFYPSGVPTTEDEYLNNVRDIADIIDDKGFAEEAGRPSITALFSNLAVGDYALMPNHEQIWAEDLTAINEAAAEDQIKPSRGWVLEITSITQPRQDRQRRHTRRNPLAR
jgi:hypothetical protein